MKRIIYILTFLLIMTGCASTGGSLNNDQSSQKTTVADKNKKVENQKANYTDTPQATDDSSLTKVGQSYKDDDGELSLKAIKPVDETYGIGPIQLRIQDVKVLHYLPAEHLLDFFHGFTHDDHYDEFDYVKFRVEIENTSDDKVKFAPVGLLAFNTGESLSWKDDFYLEELNGELKGKEKKAGNMGFIIKKTDVNQLKWIEITTSDVLDMKNNKVKSNKKIKIKIDR